LLNSFREHHKRHSPCPVVSSNRFADSLVGDELVVSLIRNQQSRTDRQ
jgi:hypothetical protein